MAALLCASCLSERCPAHVNPWPDAQSTQAARSSVKRVGALELHACGTAGAFCGRLDRPLDSAGALPDRLSIYFEFYPHSGAGAAHGTLVATEGGPGYPATESRADYLALFKPLMADHDVLIMDNRGTGRSGAIDCRALQTGDQWTIETVAECGRSLGERAALYGTADAADDLAALLAALDVRTIDLYGDSYGTYFEQVFAIRHPEALRSIVLDGAYPLSGPDYAWYPSYAPAMRDKLNLTCARSPACAALPGSSVEHIEPAVARLRAHPFAARAHDIDGRERAIEADASQLAIVMYGGAPALTTVREVDAAARAFVQGDSAPLLRLMAETATAVDSRDPTGDATHWSAGLAAAVMCQDPPQIFDMRLAPTERLIDRDRALAERRLHFPDTYAPFTIDEYRGMPLDYSFLDQCVAWPVSPPSHPASQLGLHAAYPDVPALVISGELDDITPPANGAAVAAAFKRGVQVRIANSFHVNALPRARSGCAARIVRHFMATTRLGDIACGARVPAVRLVPRFAMQSGELDAASGLPGNQASAAQLKIVTAAVLTAGDVLARVPDNSSGQGAGLRGGTFELRRDSDRIHATLNGLRWVNDVTIDGTIDRPTDRVGRVRANLVVSPTIGSKGRLTMTWVEGTEHAMVDIHGTLGNSRVATRGPAP